jgi:hypothetical protein
MENRTVLLRGRLDGRQRNRLKSLFDMLYSPRELAEEIGINKDQVYMVYMPFGCPNKRDERNHILINGKEFADWYTRVYKKIHLRLNETFCKTCQKPVKFFQPKKTSKGQLIYILSNCPNCGRKLTRIIENSRGDND